MANLTGGSNELQWAGLGILSSALRGSVPRVRVPTERVAGAAASNVKAIATSHALFLSAGLDDRPMLTWPNIAKHWPAHDVGHNVLWALTGGVNEILVTQNVEFGGLGGVGGYQRRNDVVDGIGNREACMPRPSWPEGEVRLAAEQVDPMRGFGQPRPSACEGTTVRDEAGGTAAHEARKGANAFGAHGSGFAEVSTNPHMEVLGTTGAVLNAHEIGHVLGFSLAANGPIGCWGQGGAPHACSIEKGIAGAAGSPLGVRYISGDPSHLNGMCTVQGPLSSGAYDLYLQWLEQEPLPNHHIECDPHTNPRCAQLIGRKGGRNADPSVNNGDRSCLWDGAVGASNYSCTNLRDPELHQLSPPTRSGLGVSLTAEGGFHSFKYVDLNLYDNVGKPNEFHTQWDEIPLYMLGLMSSDEARKVKDFCIVGGFDMNGPNGLQDGISPAGRPEAARGGNRHSFDTVNKTTFSVDDVIEAFGPRVPDADLRAFSPYSIYKNTIQGGVELWTADREASEAETTWWTLMYRHWEDENMENFDPIAEEAVRPV